jgi:type I restriction enzyme S subunit
MTFYKENEFQATPVGKIPKDWEVTTLKDASLLITDGSHFSPKHQENGYPLATVANMRENAIDVDSCYRISREDYERLVESGDKPGINDVLFSKDGTVGQCLVFNQKVDLIVLSSIAIIRPDQRKVDPHFLKHMLQSGSVLGRIVGSKTGTAIRRIILRDLSSTRIALPKKLEEQRGVVGVLGVVDSAIGLVDRVIWKTERLKKGLMQTLLTRGIGHTEYKDTPIGKTPKTWQILQVGDLFSLEYGKGLPDRKRIPGPYPVVGSNGVIGHHNQALVKGPGIVVGRKGTIGAVSWIDEDFWPIDTTYYVKLKTTNMSLKWLFHALAYLNPARFHLADVVPGLKRELVYSLKIGFPSLPEQEKIADVLSTIDRKLDLERKEKSRLERVKRGLMDLLLTGKVRVKVD